MSKLEVDAIEPQSGTTLTIGASGDSVNIASGATITDFTSTGIDDNATSTAITIDSSERVGIGETTPDDALLVIKGDSDENTTPSIRLKDGSDTREAWITNTAGDLYLTTGGNDNVPHTQLRMLNGDLMTFRTANSERMRITSSGQVAINTTSPDVGSITSIDHPGSSQYALRANSTQTSGTQYHLLFSRGGTAAGYLVSGSATTVNLANSSDERLKQNIENSGSAIQDIKNIQVRQFDWIDNIDTHRDFGFVAQELVNVVPEAVTRGTDTLDDNGKPVRSWGVDYSHIVPRLVKVCQEQQTKIEELETRIITLENA